MISVYFTDIGIHIGIYYRIHFGSMAKSNQFRHFYCGTIYATYNATMIYINFLKGVSMSQKKHSYQIQGYCQHTTGTQCRICGRDIRVASIGTINVKSVIIDGVDDDMHHFDMCHSHNSRSVDTYIKNNL